MFLENLDANRPVDDTRKIIAVVGLAGVGKSQVVERLAELFGCPVVYFGGQVLSEMTSRGLKPTPENERITREALREKHGMAAMAILGGSEIAKHFETEKTVIVDGLYSYEELVALQEEFGDRLLIVSVHADKTVRSERLSIRSRRPLTYKQMVERDAAEIEKLNKARPIVQGDFHIVNNGSLKELYQAVDRIAKFNENTP